MSILTAVQAAMASDAADLPDAPANPGADAPQPKEAPMAVITQADLDAAVSAARAEGHAAGVAEGTATGASAATERLTSALGSEGVAGDPARMSAALDLAKKSPTMSGADIAAYVLANVTASKPDAAATYEQHRLAAQNLAQPQKPGGDAAKTSWSKTADAINKRR